MTDIGNLLFGNGYVSMCQAGVVPGITSTIVMLDTSHRQPYFVMGLPSSPW